MWDRSDIFDALEKGPDALLSGEMARFTGTRPGPWCAGQLEKLRARGREYAGTPIEALPYSLFRLFRQTGDRVAFEKCYFERRGRLFVFSVLCWLEPEDPDWKRLLEDTVWAICAEPFWCIPAHFTDAEDGPLPMEAYATQLDLFACETAFALAEMLVLCRDRLDEAVVRQAELQIERRVFAPFLDGTRLFRFECLHNNWCAVCSGAIGGAALHLMRDRARLTNVLHRCLSCLSTYLDSFGADGVSVEGVGYWTYGFGFFTCFADLLAKRTGGRLDLFTLPAAQAVARCQQHYYLTGGYTVSFADGSTRGRFRMGLSCWLQKHITGVILPDAACADDLLHDTCYRFCLSLRDLLWCDEENTRFGLPAVRSVYLPDAQWMISCGGRLALAAKAGNNGEGHNHNDCGSFLVYKDGQPLLCDLGAGRYTADYFGPRRYELFVNASRSHNVALVDGCEQAPGAQHACRAVQAALTEGCDRFGMELAGCYDCAGLKSYTRVLTHEKAAGRLTVEDTLRFAGDGVVTEVFLSETPIRLEAGRAVFARAGVTLTLSFDAALFEAAVREERWLPHEEDGARTVWLLHLASAGAGERAFRFTIE